MIKKVKILIVDEQPCVRELLSRELVDEGYQVMTEGNEESGLGRIRFFIPDVVILDLVRDGSGGIGLFQEIKTGYPDLPVILFTANESYRDHPLFSQADAYVIKSLFMDELKTGIKEVLDSIGDGESPVDEERYWYGESFVQALDGSRQA